MKTNNKVRVEKIWFSIKEAAEYTGFAVQTLRNWVYKKIIPYYKVGSSLRFLKSDLDDFLSRHRVEARF